MDEKQSSQKEKTCFWSRFNIDMRQTHESYLHGKQAKSDRAESTPVHGSVHIGHSDYWLSKCYFWYKIVF